MLIYVAVFKNKNYIHVGFSKNNFQFPNPSLALLLLSYLSAADVF